MRILTIKKGFYDYSDTGMAYWLITGANDGGDEDATPQKTVDLYPTGIWTTRKSAFDCDGRYGS